MESPFLHLSGLLRAIGLFLSGVCHQLPEHTLAAAAGQMPLCARCTGTYWGAALGFLFLWRQRSPRAARLPRAEVMLFLTGLSFLWLIDGANSYLNFLTGDVWLYQPNNALRLATGLGSGGDAQGDTLSEIENLPGSNFDDTLEGNAGVNILVGGLGIDTVTYANAAAGVTATLLAVTPAAALA